MLATGPLVGSHGRFRSAAPLLALVFLLTAVSFPQLKGAVLLACLALPPSCLSPERRKDQPYCTAVYQRLRKHHGAQRNGL